MILVTGASGRVGLAALRALAHDDTPVRALARTRARPALREEPGVQWMHGDLGDPRSLAAALAGVETVILHSAPSPEQVALQERVVENAAAAGVQRIVKLSMLGAAPDAGCDSARGHWRVERRLAASGVSSCVVRATRTMHELQHHVPMLLMTGLLAGCQGNGRVTDVDARDVGETLAALAVTDRLPESVIELTGPEALDFPAVASLLTRELHRSIRYVDCAPADLLQCAQAAGVDRWQAHDLVAWQTEARDDRYAEVRDTAESFTGRSPRRFDAFANELATSLRYAQAPRETVSGHLSRV